MRNLSVKIKEFGTKPPRRTARNKRIGFAVKKAVDEYKEVYRRLATE